MNKRNLAIAAYVEKRFGLTGVTVNRDESNTEFLVVKGKDEFESIWSSSIDPYAAGQMYNSTIKKQLASKYYDKIYTDWTDIYDFSIEDFSARIKRILEAMLIEAESLEE